MLIKLLITFLFVCFVVYICIFRFKKEPFRSGRDKFFILRHKGKDNLLSMNTLPEHVLTVGYKNNEEKILFQQLYKLHNNDDSREFRYIEMGDDMDLTDVDILLYVNDAVYLKDYVFIDYYTDDFVKRNTYLRDYEFVLHNDVNISLFVILMSNDTSVKKYEEIILDPIETTSNTYNFEIEYGINGKYYELDMTTNEVILYQNKIANLKVMIGDKVLLKNQRKAYMNGVYEVKEINNYIRMVNEAVKVLPKNEVCIDENLEEHGYYKNKQSCEFKNNYIGEKKKVKMTWDARCRRNLECPFFDYDNEYSGGCNTNGYCEMPYNVKQISFTKYEKD